jgi:hypothetical protein
VDAVVKPYITISIHAALPCRHHIRTSRSQTKRTDKTQCIRFQSLSYSPGQKSCSSGLWIPRNQTESSQMAHFRVTPVDTGRLESVVPLGLGKPKKGFYQTTLARKSSHDHIPWPYFLFNGSCASQNFTKFIIVYLIPL